MKSGNGAVVLAQNENRIRPDLVGPVVAALRNLRLGGHEQPVTGKNPIQLGRIQGVIGKERPGQREARPMRIQQRGDLGHKEGGRPHRGTPAAFHNRGATPRAKTACALAKKGIPPVASVQSAGPTGCQGRLPPPDPAESPWPRNRRIAPIILILMADQLTARALRAYGGSVARTPHIDALAAQGVVFESFYCNSPLCAPSRFSFLAGQLPSRIGAYDNAAEFAAAVPTFAHYVRSAGYQTALAGKMHFCGPDQLHGFEERLTTDIYPADFGWTPDWTRFEERPGWYHTMDSVTQAGPCTRTNQIDFDDEVVFAARQKLFDLARGRDRRPFCLVASMTHPHDPYVVPETYWNRYRDDEIDMPRVGDLAGREDPHSTRLRHVIGLGLATPTEAQVRAARRAYYGAVSYVDDQIGILLSTLREARFADNTVVMVLADHGDMLGERGLWYKMNFFEPACRIPLIVHAPGRFAPRRVAESASLLDVLPTLAEIANGGSAPAYAAPIGGRSLLPALTGRQRPAAK